MNGMRSIAGLLLGLLVGALLTGCSAWRPLDVRIGRAVEDLLLEDRALKEAFVGFYLYDPECLSVLIDHSGHRHFTPASNTKVMTYYVASAILGDSFPVVRYVDTDSLCYLQGMGYPLLPDHASTAFLAERSEVVDCTESIPRFGSGWAWDDYVYRYQKERDLLPWHENALRFVCDTMGLRSIPPNEEIAMEMDTLLPQPIWRVEDANHFIYNPKQWPLGDTLEVPLYRAARWRHSSGPLKRRQSDLDCPEDWAQAEVLRYEMDDSIYRRLMCDSDNFIAEQLILMAACEVGFRADVPAFLRWAKDSLLAEMPDAIRWVDGSGLSRYNLQTPANMVWLLEQIWKREGAYGIARNFPVAGKEGTLSAHYHTLATPRGAAFVYAKSGSLSNNYCLSGYLFASSGRVLLFSFMANHFMGRSEDVKGALESVLYRIYEAY